MFQGSREQETANLNSMTSRLSHTSQTLPQCFPQESTWCATTQEHHKREQVKVQMFIDTGLSTTLCDNTSFKQFCQLIEHRFKTPGSAASMVKACIVKFALFSSPTRFPADCPLHWPGVAWSLSLSCCWGLWEIGLLAISTLTVAGSMPLQQEPAYWTPVFNLFCSHQNWNLCRRQHSPLYRP